MRDCRLAVALCLCLAGAVVASRYIVPPQYPDRGLDDATQVVWSRARISVQELEKRGLSVRDSLLESRLSHLTALMEPITPSPDWHVDVTHGDAPWVAAMPNGELLIHQATLCLLRNDLELDAMLAHLAQHPRLGHEPDYELPLVQELALPKRMHPIRKVLRRVFGRREEHEFSVLLSPVYDYDTELAADSAAMVLDLRAGVPELAWENLRARLDTLGLMIDCVNAHIEPGLSRRTGGATCSAPLADLQRRVLPGAVQDLCRQLDERFATQRPERAEVSPVLDSLVARGRELGLPPVRLALMEAQRDLALHGAKDSSLVELGLRLTSAMAMWPDELELTLLRARGLTLEDRLEDALFLYRRVEADPAYTGRRRIIQITINQLEAKLKDLPHDKD
jgi:hypothetical protein